MREIVQMQKAKDIIDTYDGRQPLQLHLKNYFRLHKEMGSRDRKLYTQLAFGYFRHKGMRSHADHYFVDAVAGFEQFHAFHQYWSSQLTTQDDHTWDTYFPLTTHISSEIDIPSLEKSLHNSPATWIRCKKAHVLDVIDELNTLQYPFDRDDVCIRFEQNHPLQEMQTFASGYFEIQDISSQQTATLMHPQKNQAWWDCCAGSGGKSLLLLEQEKQLQLFVSDSRESILHNLQDRFAKAGIRQFAAVLADLEQVDDASLRSIPDMQGIIADVPCSGSGTWARSPERMSFFNASDLEFHVAQQRRILAKVISKLLPGGQFLYLTCSVYRDENEEQVTWMQKTFGVQLSEMHYFQNSDRGGDTLFGALLTRN